MKKKSARKSPKAKARKLSAMDLKKSRGGRVTTCSGFTGTEETEKSEGGTWVNGRYMPAHVVI
jgi:hypothetical protein